MRPFGELARSHARTQEGGTRTLEICSLAYEAARPRWINFGFLTSYETWAADSMADADQLTRLMVLTSAPKTAARRGALRAPFEADTTLRQQHRRLQLWGVSKKTTKRRRQRSREPRQECQRRRLRPSS